MSVFDFLTLGICMQFRFRYYLLAAVFSLTFINVASADSFSWGAKGPEARLQAGIEAVKILELQADTKSIDSKVGRHTRKFQLQDATNFNLIREKLAGEDGKLDLDKVRAALGSSELTINRDKDDLTKFELVWSGDGGEARAKFKAGLTYVSGQAAAKVPTVTYFGSCRLVHPMTYLAEQGKIKVNNKGIFGMQYTAEEMMQQYRMATKKKKVPDALRYHIEPRRLVDKGEERSFSRFADTDVFVVELCSLKEIVYQSPELGKWFLHMFYFTKELIKKRKAGKHPLIPHYKYLVQEANRRHPFPAELHDYSWGRAVYDDKYTAKKVELSSLPSGFLSDSEADIFKNTKLNILTEDKFKAGMTRLAALLKKPIIFVSHMNLLGGNNRQILSRIHLDDWIKESAETIGCDYFLPGPFISRLHGQDNAVTSKEDIDHFKPGFVPKIAQHYWENYLSKYAQ